MKRLKKKIKELNYIYRRVYGASGTSRFAYIVTELVDARREISQNKVEC
jgi:hypothetical protein